MRRVLTSGLLFAAFADSELSAAALLKGTIYLGEPGRPEWSVFEGQTPVGTNLVLNFDAPGAPEEHTLFIRQDDVKQDWNLTVNGKRVGQLFLMEAPLVHALAIPAGLLKPAGNRLEISARAPDGILLHEISFERGSKAALLAAQSLTVSVHERDRAGDAFPCRITIVNERGELAALHDFGVTNIAVRPGVVYTPSGSARVGLLPGQYTIYATHGPEFGLAQTNISVPEVGDVSLSLSREVDTPGAVSADTHIHTLTLSKHGDATLAERVVTIAGEGLELPIVTEHNLHADYAQAARDLGVKHHFTTVPGNEVTTRRGHFNIFPVSLSARPPDHTIENWPALFEAIRNTPTVRVAILNHPTDMHAGFVPFAATNFNLVTGRNMRGDFDFEFDAVEVINSGAMNSDWMAPFRAWFALLNRGYRVTAIGASDSHDVSRFIVGQGRTYIAADDDWQPGQIHVAEVCENLKQGQAVVSLGLYPQLRIRNANGGEAAGPGELLSVNGTELEITAEVAAPSWISARSATLYANGRPYREFQIGGGEGLPRRVSFTVRAPVPSRDTQYVLIAHGPGVTNQFWSVARPYQPNSTVWQPVVIGATNPVRVDADRDGKFSSPRDYAARIVSLPLNEALAMLGGCDWAVAAQAAELLESEGVDLRSDEVRRQIGPAVREAFDDYLASLPPR